MVNVVPFFEMAEEIFPLIAAIPWKLTIEIVDAEKSLIDQICLLEIWWLPSSSIRESSFNVWSKFRT